jgi:putative ABC transport system substrate-binding protein
MRRRDFIALLGRAATWPPAARAQQPALPMVAFIRDGSADANARYAAEFRKGLNETGYVEGQNVTVQYHWLEGQYDRLPALLAGVVRQQVAVIATPAPSASNGSDGRAAAVRLAILCGSRTVSPAPDPFYSWRPAGPRRHITWSGENDELAKLLDLLRRQLVEIDRRRPHVGLRNSDRAPLGT